MSLPTWSRRLPVALAAAGTAWPALAADLTLKLELPRLDVAEYHRPYVAIWLERPDQSFAGNLAVWYDIKLRNQGGTKWLKDLRSWWRQSGRELTLPLDGLSTATRAPGEHSLTFAGTRAPLAGLPDGDYQLVVEAARETGGRERVKVPFQWPPKAAATAQARGREELGGISLQLRP
jgi:hypothetical protein